MSTISVSKQSEWLKVLGKGMITIPKQWRDALGIRPGDVIKASKQGNRLIIQAKDTENAPYRIYSDKEIEQFIEDDELPKSLAKKANALLSHRP